MKWFKHMTASFNDEKLSLMVDELGMEGYGFWWRTLEIIAEKLGENSESLETFCSFSAKKWGNFYGFSPKKFEKFVRIFEKFELFTVKFSENSITIDIPNILKYKDEWFRRKCKNSGVTPEAIPHEEAKEVGETPHKEKELRRREDNIYLKTPKENNININTPRTHTHTREDVCLGQADLSPVPVSCEPELVATSPSAPSALPDEPSLEFQELRELYSRLARPEGEMTGFIEFKSAKKARDWPGINRILDDINQRTEAGMFPKYAPSLARYLRERYWTAPIASPVNGSPTPTYASRDSPLPRPNTVAQQRYQERQIMAQMVLDYRKQQEAEKEASINAQGLRVITNPDGSQLTLPADW